MNGILSGLHSIYKLIISIVLAILAYTLTVIYCHDIMTSIMVGWDAFSLSLIVMSWMTFFTTTADYVRSKSEEEDESKFAIFVILLLATLSSLLTVFILIGNREHWVLSRGLETFIYIFGVCCSWVLMHTIFALHYAHMYYETHNGTPGSGGIKIPEEENPDYLDFVYFSFVAGMTYQVSDVIVTSKAFRRLTLLHSVLSFAFNTVIVALTVNELVSLK